MKIEGGTLKSLLLVVLILVCYSYNIEAQKTFTKLKRAIKKPDKVVILDLSNQQLSSFNIDERQFANLRELDLSDNLLSDFPVCILDLNELEVLKLNRTGISNIPKDIEKLNNLKELWLKSNLIEDFPDEIKYLTKLEKMVIMDNPFSPEVIDKIKCLVPRDCQIFHHHEFYEAPPNKCLGDSLTIMKN